MHRILVVVMVLGLVACGKKGDGKSEGGGGGGGGGGAVVASCDQRVMQKSESVQVCIEYVGSVWTTKEVKARCSAEGQAYLEGSCPMDGVVLSCEQMTTNPNMAANLRMYGDAEKAKQHCANVGKPM